MAFVYEESPVRGLLFLRDKTHSLQDLPHALRDLPHIFQEKPHG